MQIDVKKIDSVNSGINAKISQTTFEDKKARVAAKIAKSANIKGFRKGKAPVKLISNMYANEITQEARKELIDDVIANGLKTLEVLEETLFGAPYLIDFKEDDNGGFAFDVMVCQKPTITLENIDALIPSSETPEVSDAEIDERVSALLKSSAQLEDVSEKRALADKDFATIDFEGFVDGVAFAGGKASEYVLEIGSGSFIPGFEEGCIGMQIGETRDVSVKFPDDYQSSELAGKDAIFKVTLHKIQIKPQVQLTDENAKKILVNDPEASALKVKEAIKEQLVKEKRTKLYVDEIKPVLLEKLVETYVFDLPSSVVEQEIDVLAKNKLSTLSEEEVEAYKDVQKVEELRNELKLDAQKNVRITFIIDELARVEGVVVNDQEVAQAIMMEAYQTGQEPMKLLELYKSYNLLPAVKMALIEDRVLMKILDRVQKVEK